MENTILQVIERDEGIQLLVILNLWVETPHKGISKIDSVLCLPLFRGDIAETDDFIENFTLGLLKQLFL